MILSLPYHGFYTQHEKNKVIMFGNINLANKSIKAKAYIASQILPRHGNTHDPLDLGSVFALK